MLIKREPVSIKPLRDTSRRLPYITQTVRKHIYHFIKYTEMNPGCWVVIYLRASHSSQDKNGSLQRQEEDALKTVAELGGRVLKIVRDVGSGWWRPSADWLDGRWNFIQAANYARKHGAVLLAPSYSRLLRKFDYSPLDIDNGNATKADKVKLACATEDVDVATIQPPNLPLRKERSFETMRGLTSNTTNKGGRPKKKGRPSKYNPKCRRKWLAKVQCLQREGKSVIEVVRYLVAEARISRQVAYRWDKIAKTTTSL